MKTTQFFANPNQYQLRLLAIVLFGMLILLTMNNVQAERLAEVLKDPTQPPASFSGNATAEEGQVASGPVLQSVMIGSQYRAAIINGKKVMLGSKYEQATLIRLNEHEAILRNPDMTTQTLAMDYAGIKKAVPAISLKKTKQYVQTE